MGHSKEIEIGFINIIFVRIVSKKGLKNVFPYLGWWYKYWSLLVPPPPKPHPRRQQKSPARGANTLEHNYF